MLLCTAVPLTEGTLAMPRAQAKAYEDPDEQWYTTPDALDLYYKHYPIGTTHSCFYEKNK